MDLLLDKDGDLQINDSGDISLVESIKQKVRIKLLWFLEEWRWDRQEGIDYVQTLFTKNPNLSIIESQIREGIFEIPEVTSVDDITIDFDAKSRKAKIKLTVRTDYETVREEVQING